MCKEARGGQERKGAKGAKRGDTGGRTGSQVTTTCRVALRTHTEGRPETPTAFTRSDITGSRQWRDDFQTMGPSPGSWGQASSAPALQGMRKPGRSGPPSRGEAIDGRGRAHLRRVAPATATVSEKYRGFSVEP